MRQHRAEQQMTHLGTLSSVGKLWDGSKDLGPVDYEIQVFRTGGSKRGEGTLRSARYGLWDNVQAGKALMLMLRSGEQVSITIKSLGPEGADISATGPIPDPIKGHDFTD
jgi:hypothetical protein